jgi:hypothetical protein
MKRYWSGVFVAVGFTATAALGAQGNPPQQNTPPPDTKAPAGIQRTTPAPQADAKGNTVTVSGCIQDSPMATAGAATPAPAGAAKTFYLNNPTMAADAGRNQSAVGTSGLSLTGYRLEGDTKLLSPHVNHQVRITGSVQSSNASATGEAKSAPGSTASMPTLNVESVTMVDAKCQEKK